MVILHVGVKCRDSNFIILVNESEPRVCPDAIKSKWTPPSEKYQINK